MIDPHDLPCAVFVEMVTDYLEGALSAEDAARLDAHLTVCPPCIQVLDQWRRTIELVGRLDEVEVGGLEPYVRESLMDAFSDVHR